MKTLILYPALVILVLAQTSSHAKSENYLKVDNTLRAYVRDVLYTVSKGSKATITYRYKHKPHLEFVSSNQDLTDFAQSHFDEICKIARLKEGPDDDRVTLTIYIGEVSDLKKANRKERSKCKLKNGSGYWVWWKSRRYVSKAVIYAATDVLDEDKCKDRLLESLICTFGFPGESEEYTDTCMADDREIRLNLTELDRHFIKFFYAHVPSGTSYGLINPFVNQHWNQEPTSR